jgi:hypothetical protein
LARSTGVEHPAIRMLALIAIRIVVHLSFIIVLLWLAYWTRLRNSTCSQHLPE